MQNLDVLAAIAATAVGGYLIFNSTGSSPLEAATPSVVVAPIEQAQELTITERYRNDCIGDIENERALNPQMTFNASHTPEKACGCLLDRMAENDIAESELLVFWGENKDFGATMRMIEFSKRKEISAAKIRQKAKVLGTARFTEISNIVFKSADCTKPNNWDALHEERQAEKRRQ